MPSMTGFWIKRFMFSIYGNKNGDHLVIKNRVDSTPRTIIASGVFLSTYRYHITDPLKWRLVSQHSVLSGFQFWRNVCTRGCNPSIALSHSLFICFPVCLSCISFPCRVDIVFICNNLELDSCLKSLAIHFVGNKSYLFEGCTREKAWVSCGTKHVNVIQLRLAK